MAIDKKIYDTLETGAKNQIVSALNQGDKTGAEALYNKFKQPVVGINPVNPAPPPPAPTPAPPTTPSAPTPKSPTGEVGTYDQNKQIRPGTAPVKDNNVTTQFVTPDLGVILPGASAPTPTPTPAPVKVEQPTTTTTTEKITTPKGETTKVTAPVTPVDKNVRNQEILNNLNEGYKNDLGIQNAVNTGNWEAFKASYNMQDPEEAKIVEAYFQARQPKDIDGIFNVLLTGQKIHNQALTSNPQFKTAKDIYDDYSTMKMFSSGQFSSALKNGELVKGTKLYNELIKDPAVAINLSNAEKLNLLNKTPVNTETVTQNQTDAILSKNPTLKQALEDGTISDTEWKTLSSSPEIDNINKEVTDLKTKYDTLKRDYDNVEIDVENELKGTGATTSYKNALIAERRKGMYRDLLVSQDTYNNKLGYLTDLKKEKMDLLNMNMELYEKQEQRQYETEQKLEQRTYEEQQAQKELQQKFDYTYGDLKSTDPRIQKTAALRMAEAIQKQYEGMPFRRTVDVMASDIVNQINSGMTTEQITTDITNAIQNAPTYNEWAMQKGLIARPQEVTVDKPFSVSAGSSVYDPTTGTFKTAPGGTATTPTTTATPTGNLVTKRIGTSNAVRTLDEVAMTAFDKVASEMAKAGIKLVTGSSYRTREEQQKLYDRYVKTGKYPAAKPGTSRHESGMAIDIYSDNKLSGPTQAQIDIMAKNGFKHMAIKDDMGHFEYVGTGATSGATQDEINIFKYADKLTPNAANDYLKEKGLVNKYINYKSTQGETQGLLEGISSIQDISFPEKTTEFKSKSYSYGTRMDEAQKILNTMDSKYKKSWTTTEYLAPKGEWVPNFLKSGDRQAFEQAQRNFVNSVLRQESGAVISDQEFANAKKQYFPAPGDTEAVLNQKKNNRELAIYNMLKSAGKDEQGRDIGTIWKELNKTKIDTSKPNASVSSIKSKSGKTYNY